MSSCSSPLLFFQIPLPLSNERKYWHRNVESLLPCFHRKYPGSALIFALHSNKHMLLHPYEDQVRLQFPKVAFRRDSNRSVYEKDPRREYFFRHLPPYEFALSSRVYPG